MGTGGKAPKRNRLDGMTPIEPAACDGSKPWKASRRKPEEVYVLCSQVRKF